jgi:hypothetical protein
MAMIKISPPLFILINLLSVLLGNCTQRQSISECLTLGEIFDQVNQISSAPKASSYKDFGGFNFESFEPVNKTINLDDYYKIGYNDKGEIVEISHFERTVRLTNFKLIVFNFTKFYVCLYQDLWDDYKREKTGYFSNGFFLHDKANGRNYFINNLSQFKLRSESRDKYLGDFRRSNLSDLSSVVFIGNDLYPSHVVRISKGKVVLGSEMIYEDDNKGLSCEKVYIFNIPEFEHDLSLDINSKTCINDLLSFFDSVYQFTMVTKPIMNPKYTMVPLWTLAGGTHLYRQNCEDSPLFKSQK